MIDLAQISLTTDDDIVSICDRLNWARAQRVVLILPTAVDSRLLHERTDMARLRRHADSLRQEVGLITQHREVKYHARQLGIPIFRHLADAEDNERQWRRGKRRREQVGLTPEEIRRTLLPEEDRAEIQRRHRPRPWWHKWAWRYAGIFFFCLTLALLFVGVAYAVPGATITLRPLTKPVQVSQIVVADPQLSSINFDGASIPGRVLSVTAEWQANVATTGSVEVADAPARGRVLLINRLEQAVNVPAGTQVNTTAGSRHVFQTLAEVAVPGEVGGTAEVDVVAVRPGPASNVAANQINRVQGPLAAQLEVRNLEPTSGGDVRLAPAVSEADIARLEAQVIQYLQTTAVGQMTSLVTDDEFLAQDSVRVTNIYQQTYSHFPGEQTDRVAIEVRAEVQGTAVDTRAALDLIYSQLTTAIEPGFVLVPESFSFYADEVLGVDNQGRVSFSIVGEGILAADLDAVEAQLSEQLRLIAGQPIAVGEQHLYEQLPLAARPRVEVIPNWFGRLPYLPNRIRTDIQTQD